MCVTVASFSGGMTSKNDFTITHVLVSDQNIFQKKYVAMSSRSGAHVGERNLLLSAIRRSYTSRNKQETPEFLPLPMRADLDDF